jgi:imidazole glycerol phosphate synthase glutamine amidotransferase subunit
MSVDVVVVPTGTANLASVLAGLRRAGASPRLSELAQDIAEAPGLVLPGVGALEAAMQRLSELDLVSVLRQRFLAGKPCLAVCLGLQLLAEESEESPGVSALKVFSGKVTRFSGSLRVPQMGWNQVSPAPECRFLRPGWAYFANSYRLESVPDGWSGATTTYGSDFVAAIERGSVLACQFHPELSGTWGRELLARWVDSVRQGGG